MNQVLIDKLNLIAYDNKTVYPPIELRDLDEEARSERLDDALLRQPATGNIGENHVLVDSIEDVLPQDLVPEEDEHHHLTQEVTPLVEQDYSSSPNLFDPPNTEYEEVTGAANDGREVEVEENSESLSNVEEPVRSEPEFDEAPQSIVRQESNPVTLTLMLVPLTQQE